jgi:hypothetical protein
LISSKEEKGGMKIIEGVVDWRPQWKNRPTLKILIDEEPKAEDLIYEQRDDLFFAEHEGYVSIFSYMFPGNGYGGKKFKLKMKDGSTEILKGPFSGNTSASNATGFEPSMEVYIATSIDHWERDFFHSAMCTCKAVEEAAKQDLIEIGDSYLRVDSFGRTYGNRKHFKKHNAKFILIHQGDEENAVWCSDYSHDQMIAMFGGGGGCWFEQGVVFHRGKVWTKPF